MKKLNILIYTEDIHEHNCPNARAAYPTTLHDGIAGAFPAEKYNVRASETANIRETITPEILADTDVLFWWGHCHHHNVPDDIAALVIKEAQKGMGFVALHSAHISKPLTGLLGTSGSLGWRVPSRERVWVTAPYHPIAAGVPAHFELHVEEMYGEPFDIPAPEDTVFIGWFSGGEVFRSGVTFRRGYGKIFYFQPGHEEYPIYHNETVRLILRNAADWAAPTIRRAVIDCPNMKPAEKHWEDE